MSGIRSTDTGPEIAIRKGLHKRGFRFRLHNGALPGKPDIVLSKYSAVIFVNGCFWHRHDCHLFRWPKSREEFWVEKLNGNVARDVFNQNQLAEQGWRVARVWECALKGKHKLSLDTVLDECAEWFEGKLKTLDIKGNE